MFLYWVCNLLKKISIIYRALIKFCLHKKLWMMVSFETPNSSDKHVHEKTEKSYYIFIFKVGYIFPPYSYMCCKINIRIYQEAKGLAFTTKQQEGWRLKSKQPWRFWHMFSFIWSSEAVSYYSHISSCKQHLFLSLL